MVGDDDGRGVMRVVNGVVNGDEDGDKERRMAAVVVDREHRSLVRSLIGSPPPRRSGSGGGGGGGVVDGKALRRVERNLSALGF